MNAVQDILRQKRESFHVQIRKERNEQVFRHKRRLLTNVAVPDSMDPQDIENNAIEWIQALTDACISKDVSAMIEIVKMISQFLYLPDSYMQLKLQQLKKVNIISILNRIFEDYDDFALNKELLNVYVNIFCHEIFFELDQLREESFVLKLYDLLEYPILQSTIFHILANLIANSKDIDVDREKKQILIKHQFLERIEQIWISQKYDITSESFEIFTWFIQNFIDKLDISYVDQPLSNGHVKSGSIIFRYLRFVLILQSTDFLPVQLNLLKIMSTACQLNEIYITYLIKQGMLDWVIKCLDIQQLRVAAIDVIADMCAGDDSSQDILIEKNILDVLFTFLKECNQESNINRIFWCISNLICNKNEDLVMVVIQHKIFAELISISFGLTRIGVNEFMHLISNLSLLNLPNRRSIFRKVLVMDNFIESVIYQLGTTQGESIILKGLKSIISMAEAFRETQVGDANFAIEIFNSRGLEAKLNELQLSSSSSVSQTALSIFECYYL